MVYENNEHIGVSRVSCRPVNVDAHFFGERDMVQLRNNLLDGQIQICAPEVLMLFTDNFDYQVKLLLANSEASDSTMQSL